MSSIPRRASREPREGLRFPSQILAENVRNIRSIRRLTQDDLAERMSNLDQGKWSRATVSEVERALRSVTVDELFALGVALDTSIARLLDPTGVEGQQGLGVDFGGPAGVNAGFARGWVRADKPLALLSWDGNKPGEEVLLSAEAIGDEETDG